MRSLKLPVVKKSTALEKGAASHPVSTSTFLQALDVFDLPGLLSIWQKQLKFLCMFCIHNFFELFWKKINKSLLVLTIGQTTQKFHNKELSFCLLDSKQPKDSLFPHLSSLPFLHSATCRGFLWQTTEEDSSKPKNYSSLLSNTAIWV